MAKEIKYIQLYQYGGPVAELVIDGEKHLYEPEGVQELIRKQELDNKDTTTLVRALNDLKECQWVYYYLPEITEDAMSGQLNIGTCGTDNAEARISN